MTSRKDATYTIVARMFGRDMPLLSVHGYERAERHAQHISARTGNATWLRADEVICASAEVIEATGVEIVLA